MINRKNIRKYIKDLHGKGVTRVEIEKLGSGVQGSGFLIDVHTVKGLKSYVIKCLFPSGLGHDYPSDRAAVFLQDLDDFRKLPRHVKAVDVLSEKNDGSIISIGGGREYYLLMERTEGKHYFNDLEEFSKKEKLEASDIEKIRSMTSYLSEIHSVKKTSRPLYWRKIRDIIGHGECLMGVFDTYPDRTISYREMADIEKKCVDWRARLKNKTDRLCQVHGDFHPGNIWFKEKGDFILLDRSRGAYGDAADDVAALTINYIFFSINHFGNLQGPYMEAFRLFFREYLGKTGDTELLKVVAPFYAFRGAVIANPVFYPDVSKVKRRKILNFVHNVLNSRSFNPERVNEYLKKGGMGDA
jgi:aminoglycoside phosphotransferase (APT) family kinase protein